MLQIEKRKPHKQESLKSERRWGEVGYRLHFYCKSFISCLPHPDTAFSLSFPHEHLTTLFRLFTSRVLIQWPTYPAASPLRALLMLTPELSNFLMATFSSAKSVLQLSRELTGPPWCLGHFCHLSVFDFPHITATTFYGAITGSHVVSSVTFYSVTISYLLLKLMPSIFL